MTKKMKKTDVGRAIRRMRQGRGETARGLSKRAGLSYTVVCKIETGRNPNPSLDTLGKLAKALETTVGALLGEV